MRWTQKQLTLVVICRIMLIKICMSAGINLMKLKNLSLLFTLISMFSSASLTWAEDAPSPPTPPEAQVAPEPAPPPKSDKPFNLCDFKVVSMEEIFNAATRDGTQMGELEQITMGSGDKSEVIGVVFEQFVAFYKVDLGSQLMAQCKKPETPEPPKEDKTSI